MLKLALASPMFVLLPLLALVADGQTPSANWETVRMLNSGTDLRVVSGTAKPVTGKMESVTDSTLVLTRGSRQQAFEKTQIASVAVKKAGHRLRNTLIGFGVGLIGGLGIGAAAGHGCTKFLCGPADVLLGGIVGTAGGTATGAFWPTGGWRKVYQQ